MFNKNKVVASSSLVRTAGAQGETDLRKIKEDQLTSESAVEFSNAIPWLIPFGAPAKGGNAINSYLITVLETYINGAKEKLNKDIDLLNNKVNKYNNLVARFVYTISDIDGLDESWTAWGGITFTQISKREKSNVIYGGSDIESITSNKYKFNFVINDNIVSFGLKSSPHAQYNFIINNQETEEKLDVDWLPDFKDLYQKTQKRK
jgi:hypothetical protein